MATPFELRLSVLLMAKELAMEEYYMKRDHEESKWGRECENARAVGASLPEKPTPIEFPTNQQIIEKATALNQFIALKTS